MITRNENVVRVTLTLDPIDVDLLDRLAALEGANRSAELRGILMQARPMLRQTVETFEAAARQRDLFNLAAAQLEVSKLQQIQPEVQRLQDAFMGALARVEGLQASELPAELDDSDPRSSNTGVTPPPHLYPESPENPENTEN